MPANKLVLADEWRAARFNHTATPVDSSARARVRD
jgi:hypothetical protein